MPAESGQNGHEAGRSRPMSGTRAILRADFTILVTWGTVGLAGQRRHCAIGRSGSSRPVTVSPCETAPRNSPAKADYRAGCGPGSWGRIPLGRSCVAPLPDVHALPIRGASVPVRLRRFAIKSANVCGLGFGSRTASRCRRATGTSQTTYGQILKKFFAFYERDYSRVTSDDREDHN